MTTQPLTFRARIEKALTNMIGKIDPPDLTNTGTYLSAYFLWDTIEKYAEKQKMNTLTKMKDNGLYNEEELKAKPKGVYEAVGSKGFTLTVNVSDPVNRFNFARMCEFASKSKFKVPAAIMSLWYEDSKIPTEPQLRKAIVEK